MKVEALSPTPKKRIVFNLSSYKYLPKKSGCYILTTHDDLVLYIGLTMDLSKRFRQHVDNPQKTSPTIEGKAFWFYYEEYNKINLEQLERTWLNQYKSLHGQNPVLNKIDSPIR